MKAFMSIMVVICCVVVSEMVLHNGFSFADEKEFSLEIPLSEGIEAEVTQDYEKAIESYRKVLFVDGTNMRAQFGLARSLEKSGRTVNAIREYRIFLKIAKDDTTLPQSERAAYVADAESALQELCQGATKGLACLSFFQINILLVTGLLGLVLLIKLVKTITERGPGIHDEDRKLVDIWKDKKVLAETEREIRLLPIDVVTIAMIGLWIFFCWQSYTILRGQ